MNNNGLPSSIFTSAPDLSATTTTTTMVQHDDIEDRGHRITRHASSSQREATHQKDRVHLCGLDTVPVGHDDTLSSLSIIEQIKCAYGPVIPEAVPLEIGTSNGRFFYIFLGIVW